jgi:hypothetical protein
VHDLKTLLLASIELALLRKENRQLRKEITEVRAARIDCDLSADSIPALCRKQAG